MSQRGVERRARGAGRCCQWSTFFCSATARTAEQPNTGLQSRSRIWIISEIIPINTTQGKRFFIYVLRVFLLFYFLPTGGWNDLLFLLCCFHFSMGTAVSKRKNLKNDAISSVAAKVRWVSDRYSRMTVLIGCWSGRCGGVFKCPTEPQAINAESIVYIPPLYSENVIQIIKQKFNELYGFIIAGQCGHLVNQCGYLIIC